MSSPRYSIAHWRTRLANIAPGPILGTLKRMVESQAQTVTLNLVDDLGEHDLLETMLEDSKPALAPELARLDYLLRSPWRYPPLRWGSRFGHRHEPGIFYGALSEQALFAETAYYRLVFLEGPRSAFRDRVISQHTLFEARFQTSAGFDLSQAPLNEDHEILTHPSDYQACQNLGSALRERDCEAFIYRSARVGEQVTQGNNVALLQPAALQSRKHRNPQPVLCESTRELVLLRHRARVWRFEREQFTNAGELPQPA
ncbi:MAG: RES family NAD+ phosphorylase [Pseudomonadales bacterium]